jgi:hypothetical protein
MTLAEELLGIIPKKKLEGRVVRFYNEEELPDPIQSEKAAAYQDWRRRNPEKVKAHRAAWNAKRREMTRLQKMNRKYFGA